MLPRAQRPWRIFIIEGLSTNLPERTSIKELWRVLDLAITEPVHILKFNPLNFSIGFLFEFKYKMKGLHGFCGAGGQVLVLDMQRRRQQCKQVFSGGGADEGWAYFFATPSHSSTSTTAMSYRNIMNSNE